MTLATWFSFLAICCLGAMSPGPSLAVVLRHTVNNGRGHGLAASWFHAAGVGVWAMATVSGLAVVIAQSPNVYIAITWAGAAYLAWLGIKSLHAGPASALDVAKAEPASVWRAGLDGAAISFLNPKLAIFFIALFSQFVSRDADVSDHALMVATATLVDGLWYTLVAVVLSHGPILGRLQRHSQLINRLTGGVLILLALRVVTL
ncbi:MAG: LysE family translocator [Rhodospirillales bacterium]|nr:LysE family translocator [Rhodospirillales bacterium]